MTNVLFVKANPRPIEQSVTVKLYHQFLNSYNEAHPEDQITELDLYEQPIPYYNTDMINGMFKKNRGLELTANEQQAVDLVHGYLDPFLQADKVVFAFPMWNLSVSAGLHSYMDYLNQAGLTFSYTEEGPVGLLSDKKIVLLHASGGVFPVNEALGFMTRILNFFGIDDIQSVVIEGHNKWRDQADEIIDQGLANAASLARQF